MHIKSKTAEELYEAWALDSGDRSDILSALEEAFMSGVSCGGMDKDLFQEALDLFQEDQSKKVEINLPRR